MPILPVQTNSVNFLKIQTQATGKKTGEFVGTCITILNEFTEQTRNEKKTGGRTS